MTTDTTPERQTRTYPLRGIEFRDAPDGGYTISGYAAVFGSPSEDLGGFTETIARHAFKPALARSDLNVKLLFDHAGMPLASTRGGTLRLTEDPRGLKVDANVSDTQLGRDLRVALKRGDLDKMSFAFEIGQQDWTPTAKGGRANVTKVSRLYDVSIVSQPAYSQTSVHARKAQQEQQAFEIRKRALLAEIEADLARVFADA